MNSDKIILEKRASMGSTMTSDMAYNA